MADITTNGIKIEFVQYSNVSILADVSLHGGSQPDETGWLSGAGAAAGNYPGNLTPFQATNNDATNTSGGSLRMITIKYDKTRTNADTMTLSGANGTSLSEIVAVVGQVNGAANAHDIATFAGLVLTLEAEAAAANSMITLLVQ